MKLFLENGIVKSINDPNMQGKIQIEIPPYTNGGMEEDLPWAIPFLSNISNKTLSNDLPELNSNVWILRDELWKKFYYITNRYFYTFFDYSKIQKKLSAITTLDTTYSHLQFNLYSNGTLTFHNKNDGSMGIIHQDSSYIVYDKNKDVLIKYNNDVSININGNLTDTINGNMNNTINGKVTSTVNGLNLTSKSNIEITSLKPSPIKFGNSISTLGNLLSELCDVVSGLVTEGTSKMQTTSASSKIQINILKGKIKNVLS